MRIEKRPPRRWDRKPVFQVWRKEGVKGFMVFDSSAEHAGDFFSSIANGQTKTPQALKPTLVLQRLRPD
jgi:hypothetical protein